MLQHIWGWKVTGYNPVELPKFLFVVVPHTSNWDFLVGYFASRMLGLESRFFAKKSLFKFPYGWFFRYLGGYPVERKKNINQVDAIANIFNSHENFSAVITPEGTRSYNPNWRTGFYYIAEKASLPIVLAGFDYPTKTVIINPPFQTTGNLEADIEKMKAFGRTIRAKFPENGIK